MGITESMNGRPTSRWPNSAPRQHAGRTWPSCAAGWLERQCVNVIQTHHEPIHIHHLAIPGAESQLLLKQLVKGTRIRARVLYGMFMSAEGADVVRRVLRYLIGAYWQRFCGCPASEDQKRWIAGNSEQLHLPFKLVKIHKKRVVDMAG